MSLGILVLRFDSGTGLVCRIFFGPLVPSLEQSDHERRGERLLFFRFFVSSQSIGRNWLDFHLLAFVDILVYCVDIYSLLDCS